jgi:hypothetical protein
MLAGAWSPAAARPTPLADVAAASSDVVRVVAVGDIAASNGLDDRVAQLVARLSPDTLLLLGDIAYPNGSTSDFATYFAPDWSQFSGIWMPVPGNHEYRTAGAAGYRAFFGMPSGPLYSSRQVGAWRVLGLDSETLSDGRQLTWLRSQLEAHDGQPTLVMWHRARYSSGEHGDQADTGVLWDAIKDDPDVRLVLWGHDHDYERMAVPVAGRAPITAMVVGTGGGELRPTPTMVDRAWRQFYVDQTTGVLDLLLSSAGFTWAFLTADGQTLDQGSETLAPPVVAPQTTARTASVVVKPVRSRSRLAVNVNPNRGRGYWVFTVERKRADGSWAALRTYRTKGTKETRTLDLKRGTYRVQVRAKYGYGATTSRPVALVR